jgi:hypothetical protein
MFAEPGSQDRCVGERDDPVLAAFAVVGDVRAGSEVQVGAGQPR